ncbi:hypothetical protein F5Y03DRAFT_397418 [Xylaria venustula]|nr:hypothetical protein F5Y03DRAFT_397418 [Xylaria venustula]
MSKRGAITSSSQLWSFISLAKPTETIPIRTYVPGFPSTTFENQEKQKARDSAFTPALSNFYDFQKRDRSYHTAVRMALVGSGKFKSGLCVFEVLEQLEPAIVLL